MSRAGPPRSGRHADRVTNSVPVDASRGAGRPEAAYVVERLVEEEMADIRQAVGDEAFAKGRWDDARSLFTDMALSDDYEDFLTLPAYERMP